MASSLLQFFLGSVRLVTRGGRGYWAWLSFLGILMLIGLHGYRQQTAVGLIATNMRDQVSWGFYIGNFTFLVGVAAAAVLLVIPAYVYQWKPIKEVALLGELLAISAIVMCLLFVLADMGRPDRLWEIIPFIGSLNVPRSILAWDTLVLNTYLLLNFVIVTHLLYKGFFREEYKKTIVVPLVLFSIPAAISIHTVTAFVYNGLVARPFWNASILAPRFIASAFCSGPAILLVLFQILRRATRFHISDEAIWKVAELMAFLLFLVPSTRKHPFTLNLGCLLIYSGVYIEKGMGLVIPGMTPDTLGEIYEYTPTRVEVEVAAGIFAVGFLVFTLLVKVAVPIVMGEFGIDDLRRERQAEARAH